MSKRTIEIEDNLQDYCDTAIEEVKAILIVAFKDDRLEEGDSVPEIGELDHDGQVNQIIDSNVPVQTYEIEAQWFLHKSELEEAYENAGAGNNPLENNGMTAIYYYICDAVNEWYSENGEDFLNEWLEEQKNNTSPTAGV
jgi:hypothetical protein